MEDNKEMVVNERNEGIQSFDELGKGKSTTKCNIYSTITDEKVIFNLENKVDKLINDCEGESLRVKDILLKIYKKPMKEPSVDEETGEVLKDTETTMSCILIDEQNISYATGSKSFSIQLMRFIQMFGINKIKENGLEIKIIKRKVGDKGNKALGFELI